MKPKGTLSNNRKLLLMHFGFQYPDWLKAIAAGDERSECYKNNCNMVEKAAKLAGGEIYEYLLEGVTNDSITTFRQLAAMGIPCERKFYNSCKRKYYELLSIYYGY